MRWSGGSCGVWGAAGGEGRGLQNAFKMRRHGIANIPATANPACGAMHFTNRRHARPDGKGVLTRGMTAVVLMLIVWIAADYRRQKRLLRELEAGGAVRRSGRSATDMR